MSAISSPHNPQYLQWKRLLDGRTLNKEPYFILSGEKMIHEYLKKPNLELVAEIVPVDERPVSGQQRTYFLPQKLFDSLDVMGTHYNLLVLKQPEIPNWDKLEDFNGVELWCPLGDPGNLGALLRSCEAFNVSRVVLTKEACHPFHPKTIKASASSVLRLPLRWGPSITQFPKSQNETDPPAFALDMKGTPLNKFKWPKKSRLLIGEEGPGIPKEIICEKIAISMKGVESLNATIAASIALYHHQENS